MKKTIKEFFSLFKSHDTEKDIEKIMKNMKNDIEKIMKNKIQEPIEIDKEEIDNFNIEKARLMTKQYYPQDLLPEILFKIKKASQQGNNELRIYILPIHIKKELINKGFKIINKDVIIFIGNRPSLEKGTFISWE